MTTRTLPESYRQVYHLSIEDTDLLLKLNLYSLPLAIVFVVLMLLWSQFAQQLRGAYVVSDELPGLVLWLAVILVLPLHELMHGLAMRITGEKPRYGAKFTRLGPVPVPYVLYATADGVYFPRDTFIFIALLPILAITLLGMLLVVLLPDYMTLYIAIAVVINGSGAIGDVWMTLAALRHPPSALVLDEEDSIRIFAQGTDDA